MSTTMFASMLFTDNFQMHTSSYSFNSYLVKIHALLWFVFDFLQKESVQAIQQQGMTFQGDTGVLGAALVLQARHTLEGFCHNGTLHVNERGTRDLLGHTSAHCPPRLPVSLLKQVIMSILSVYQAF